MFRITRKGKYYLDVESSKVKLYLAVERFPRSRKQIGKPYLSGFRKFDLGHMMVYSIVVGTFRAMIGIRKDERECNSIKSQ